jgi:hypothetical protein
MNDENFKIVSEGKLLSNRYVKQVFYRFGAHTCSKAALGILAHLDRICCVLMQHILDFIRQI